MKSIILGITLLFATATAQASNGIGTDPNCASKTESEKSDNTNVSREKSAERILAGKTSTYDVNSRDAEINK